jgi:hypothetical protein
LGTARRNINENRNVNRGGRGIFGTQGKSVRYITLSIITESGILGGQAAKSS